MNHGAHQPPAPDREGQGTCQMVLRFRENALCLFKEQDKKTDSPDLLDCCVSVKKQGYFSWNPAGTSKQQLTYFSSEVMKFDGLTERELWLTLA